jgi:hypothetical protein
MLAYFGAADNNIVDRWRYIYALNYYIYKEWWINEKQAKEQGEN